MDNVAQFRKLAEAIQIGEMVLRNRMVMAPMGTAFASSEGQVTDKMKGYYEARTKGGVGMVIVENTSVDFDRGRHRVRALCIDDERYLSGLSELAQLIKNHGARAAVQLHHAGRMGKHEFAGVQPVAPSPIAAPGGELPRELTVEEIIDIVIRFANGAKLAKKAGFEGIEIHAAHPYLIAQFLSRASNKRQDEYGGSLMKRVRLLLEVIKAVREAVGKSFPVWCRINASEFGIEDGLSLDEALEIVEMVKESPVDAISVSAFGYGKFSTAHIPDIPGTYIPMAAEVRKRISQPVMAAGMITPEVGEEALRDGKIDIVILGRALLADPEFPNKVVSGRVEEIRPCIQCYVCRDSRFTGGVLRCSVNAALGREKEYNLRSVNQAKQVVVIGSGPAGMEAARVAAMRGFGVRLYERQKKVGGQLLVASAPPHKERIRRLNDYFLTQLKKLNVQIELEKEATPGFIREVKADAIIIATGINTVVPKLPGVDGANVMLAQQVLAGETETGVRVVIIGGGMVGCETAEFLEERGRKVTIIEVLPELAVNMRPTPREKLLDRLAEKPIDIFTRAQCERMTEQGLVITDREGKSRTIQADTVVWATGAIPSLELFDALKEVLPEIYRAGDCVEPRGIMEAIDEGMQVAFGLR